MSGDTIREAHDIAGAVEMARHWMRHPERITEAGFPQVSRELYTISRALVRADALVGEAAAKDEEIEELRREVWLLSAQLCLESGSGAPAQPAEDEVMSVAMRYLEAGDPGSAYHTLKDAGVVPAQPAVCDSCGATKPEPDVICPSCGNSPAQPAEWEVAVEKAIESQRREDAVEAFRRIREAHGRGASSGGETYG